MENELKWEDVTIMTDFKAKLDSISEPAVIASGRRLEEKSEKENSLGTIESLASKALYALWTRQEAERDVFLSQAKLADSSEMEDQLIQSAMMADVLREIAKAVFWGQVKAELGLWNMENIGVRKGWTIVRLQDRPSPHMMLQSMFGEGE